MYNPELNYARESESVPTVANEARSNLMGEQEILNNILGVQNVVLRLMIPEGLKKEFNETDGEQVGSFGDFLSYNWIKQYSGLFRFYVDEIRSSLPEEKEEIAKFRERLITGLLTTDDYETIKTYLEAPENEAKDEDGKIGGKFLATDTEIAELKEKYRMSLN